jgi:hypothetical protein
MAKIDYGTVEYFTLLDLSDRLKVWQYDKLDLQNLDKLRFEVEQKLAAINHERDEKIREKCRVEIDQRIIKRLEARE